MPVQHPPAGNNVPSTRSRKRPAETQIEDAELALGKLAAATGEKIARHGWSRAINEARGKSNISAAVCRVPHKAARLLEHLRIRGAAVPVATPP